MSIMDGFKLWIGRVLAEVALVVGVVGTLAALFFLLVVAARIETAILRWKQSRKAKGKA